MDEGRKSARRDDDLLDDAVEYFSTCFPNPGRDGCPHPARLRDLASSAHLVTGEVRAHLFQCSECFKELRRGTSISTEAAAPVIVMRPGPTRFEIQLPLGYPDGLYQVAIVDPFDEVLVEASAPAVDRVLVADADATDLESGRRFLRIGAAGQPPDYLPIVVTDP